MKVLFIAALSPYPAVSGGQRLTRDEIEVYARFATVDLLSYYEQTDETAVPLMREHLANICRKMDFVPSATKFGKNKAQQLALYARSFLGAVPFRVQKFAIPAMQKLIGQYIASEKYDIVHFEHLSSTAFIDTARQSGAQIIVTEQNVEWEIFARYEKNAKNPLLRALHRREAAKLRQFENATLNKADLIVALSDRDKQIFQDDGVKPPIYVFQRPTELSDQPITSFERARPEVATLGALSSPAREHGTLWMHEHVWPLVRKQLPEATWHIIGMDPPDSIRNLHNSRDILVHGFIEDLNAKLIHCRAVAVPLLIGGGIRIKILDMLSLGMPCVSTTVGAQGLENNGIVISDDPQRFAEGIVQCLSSPDQWNAMSSAGRRFILENYSPEAVAQAYLSFLTQVLDSSETTEPTSSDALDPDAETA